MLIWRGKERQAILGLRLARGNQFPTANSRIYNFSYGINHQRWIIKLNKMAAPLRYYLSGDRSAAEFFLGMECDDAAAARETAACGTHVWLPLQHNIHYQTQWR
jgi:hypothetical protein